MPQETSKSPEPRSLAPFSGETFFTEEIDGVLRYYCAICKKGPFTGQPGLKRHFTRMHNAPSASILRKRFVKEMRKAGVR